MAQSTLVVAATMLACSLCFAEAGHKPLEPMGDTAQELDSGGRPMAVGRRGMNQRVNGLTDATPKARAAGRLAEQAGPAPAAASAFCEAGKKQ